MNEERSIRTLQYVYEYSGESIFFIEIVNTFNFLHPKSVEYSSIVMETNVRLILNDSLSVDFFWDGQSSRLEVFLVQNIGHFIFQRDKKHLIVLKEKFEIQDIKGILFDIKRSFQQHLMPVIRREMWIDELLKKKS
jgi:hypothetical protein